MVKLKDFLEVSEPLTPKEENIALEPISEPKEILSVENIEKIEKEPKTQVNKSLELNLIKSIYANRFGSTTNKTLEHMIRKIKNAWKY